MGFLKVYPPLFDHRTATSRVKVGWKDIHSYSSLRDRLRYLEKFRSRLPVGSNAQEFVEAVFSIASTNLRVFLKTLVYCELIIGNKNLAVLDPDSGREFLSGEKRLLEKYGDGRPSIITEAIKQRSILHKRQGSGEHLAVPILGRLPEQRLFGAMLFFNQTRQGFGPFYKDDMIVIRAFAEMVSDRLFAKAAAISS